jgi:hypothetical protein
MVKNRWRGTRGAFQVLGASTRMARAGGASAQNRQRRQQIAQWPVGRESGPNRHDAVTPPGTFALAWRARGSRCSRNLAVSAGRRSLRALHGSWLGRVHRPKAVHALTGGSSGSLHRLHANAEGDGFVTRRQSGESLDANRPRALTKCRRRPKAAFWVPASKVSVLPALTESWRRQQTARKRVSGVRRRPDRRQNDAPQRRRATRSGRPFAAAPVTLRR